MIKVKFFMETLEIKHKNIFLMSYDTLIDQYGGYLYTSIKHKNILLIATEYLICNNCLFLDLLLALGYSKPD